MLYNTLLLAMNLASNKSITPVSLVGANEQMTHVMDYFFSHAGAEHYKLSDLDQSKIIILDIDSMEGKKFFKQELASHRDKKLILISVHKHDQDDITYVPKPVKPEALLAAIDTVQKSLNEVSETSQDRNPHPHDGDDESDQQQSTVPPTLSHERVTTTEHLGPGKKKLTLDIDLEKIEQSVSTQEIPNIKAAGKKDIITPISTFEESSPGKMDTAFASISSNTDSSRSATRDDESASPDKAAITQESYIVRPSKYDRLIGSAPDIDLNDPEQLKRREYKPEEYFQNYFSRIITEARLHNKAARLDISHSSFVALPDRITVLTNTSESRLHALSSIPLAEKTLTTYLLDDKQLEQFRQNATPVSSYRLLWKAAIWASRGRLPAGTDPFAPVHFQHWEEVSEKILLFNHAELIANLWLRQSLSLLQTTKMLDIPQRYIFTFYSACNAIGLAFVNKQDGKRAHRKKDMANKFSLMRKVIKRFKHS